LALPEEDPFLTTRFISDKRREQESARHLLSQLEKKDQAIVDLKQELALRDQETINLKQKLAKREQVIARLRDHSGLQGKRRKPHAKRS
jgi:hypothetical protein